MKTIFLTSLYVIASFLLASAGDLIQNAETSNYDNRMIKLYKDKNWSA